MIPLAGIAFVGILIFFERLFYLHRGQIRASEFVAGIKESLKKRRLLEALTICDDTPGPVPRVVKAVLLSSEGKKGEMEAAAEAAAINEFALIERRVASLALVAKIAPLAGLLGTVVALLEIFHEMGEKKGYAAASDFSIFVYNALLSSAFGLVICIFAYVGYSFLNGRVRALAHDIEWSANETVLFISRGMPEKENLRMGGK